MILLVPSDVLRPRRPDEHFAAEAAAAQAAGLPVALVDHDALQQPGGGRRGVGLVPAGHEAVYRGWMLRSEQYAAFEAALADRQVSLRTTADQYARAHELPGWYPALAEVTPESFWTVDDERDAFDGICADLGAGPAVLRDYTKSMKHYWDEAAFIPDVANPAVARQVAARFRELREEDFTGGFVLRRFEHFVSPEIRTWWVGGRCALITAHPDTPGDHPADNLDAMRFAPFVSALGLPFVTLDLRLRADGVWRVIELGDGQVSDRPETMSPDVFIAAIVGQGA